MASTFYPALELLRTNDYISIAQITVVIYDYLLNFPREIDYVWRRPWTWIFMMFVIVRYAGLSWVILTSLDGGLFAPGPQIVSTVIFFAESCAFLLFLHAADWVMILRVYTMWNRSKTILCVLLLIYMIQMATSIMEVVHYLSPNYVVVTQVVDISFCAIGYSMGLLFLCIDVPRFVLGATLLVLAVIPTLGQSVQMYRATKLWQPNRYMQLFMRDGILYFLMNVCYNVTAWGVNGGSINGTSDLFLSSFATIGICVMMPRFIIDVRELYDRDTRGRWQGVGTGLGVFSQSISSQHAVVSAIQFAVVASGQGQAEEAEDESEGIRLEPRGDDMGLV